jgi:hypothetical protein
LDTIKKDKACADLKEARDLGYEGTDLFIK